MKMVIVLLGAPGAGKGTVAQYLKDRCSVYHFSTGNLLRNEIKEKTDIGLRVVNILESGGFVDDVTVNEIVEKNLLGVCNEDAIVVLDGYPRTKDQAVALESMMDGKIKDVIRVIDIDLDTESAVARITKRRVCAKCGNTYGPQDAEVVCSCGGDLVKRKDDAEDVVRSRMRKYEEETAPISAYFAARLVKVSGEGSPGDVTQRVDEILRGFGV